MLNSSDDENMDVKIFILNIQNSQMSNAFCSLAVHQEHLLKVEMKLEEGGGAPMNGQLSLKNIPTKVKQQEFRSLAT